MRSTYIVSTLCLLVVLLLMPYLGMSASADSRKQDIVLTLPAEVVLETLQKILPLAIPSQNRHLQGDIILESLDQLSIHNNVLSAHGVLSGKNLVILTNIAGQDIQLRVGEVHLPMTCDLQTRFDPVRGKLFVTPRFRDNSQAANNQEDALAPLLGSLAGREYQVDLDALQLLHITIGDRSIPLAMDPVSIAGKDNAMIFRLQPRVGSHK